MNLFDSLTANTLLLTPNRRLAAFYSKKFQHHQISSGKKCWETLDILPFTSWLERTWKTYTHQYRIESSILLSSSQELIIWEEIINQSAEGKALLKKSDTAEIAKSAWGMLKQWNLSIDDPLLTTTEDSQVFLKWAHLFKQQCKAKKWIDQNSLISLIIEKISENKIMLPEKIIFIGFTEFSPYYQKLLDILQSQKINILHHSQKPRSNIIKKISLTDQETEIRTLARWAKAMITDSTKENTKTIACIIPNLEDHRELVSRVFTEIFTPEGYYIPQSLTLPFNISAGKNLINYPIIHTAFQLLQLDCSNITIQELSIILRSPFIGDAENEMLIRSDFDKQLHQDNISEISLTKLMAYHNKPQLMLSRFKQFFEKKESLEDRLSVDLWVNHITELLKLLGWPGERSVNSEEYQVIQNWIKLLSEYATYETILPELNYSTAIHYLKRLTANAVFQPESPEAPIQILGLLEAAEISFDAIWVAGMDDSSWPPSPKPNPFIPQQLQRKLQMPHATAERELDFCQKITSQLKNAADYVVFSHALHNEESEMQASALLENIQEIELAELKLSYDRQISHLIFTKKEVEIKQDDKALAINDINTIYGGAKIFESQAMCPFKAFAEFRLHAKAIDEIKPGLRPLDRGNITHKAFEIIWNNLKNSHILHSQSTEELELLVQSAIEQAIRVTINDTTKSIHYFTLESQRLQKIIMDWMVNIEKSRPHFSVIAQEKQYQITLANIKVNLRIDRIDELESNKKMIIDYKTGKGHSIHSWFGERIDAPQLPLYCLIDPENTIAVAFGLINPEKMELKGISKNSINIKTIPSITEIKAGNATTWNEQITIWRDTLEKTGSDFTQGIAIVDPKNGLNTCVHCKLQSLCRIYEKENVYSQEMVMPVK